ncbi:MAG TPA: cytochrome c biogenesis CcdA family protein [Candidatus Dormibacteraeota bacterium]|jgi:cytochrome c-type biogenesis protein
MLDHISPLLALLAGLVSFLSPCVLPLVPAYIAYLGGRAGEQEAPPRTRLILAGIAFVVGLTLVFVLFFYAFQTVLSPFLPILEPIAGVLVILLALQLLGVLRLDFLQGEHRLMKTAPTGGGVGGGLLLGLGFATGWTPCVGPTLGAILTSGLDHGASGQGLLLIFFYSLGLGLPFLLLAAGFEWAAPAVRALNRRRRMIDFASAGVLTLMGLLLLTNHLAWVTIQFSQLLPEWVNKSVAL